MRVIAGKARRLQLKTIDGMGTRPTTDRIKETLFNMINKNCCINFGAAVFFMYSQPKQQQGGGERHSEGGKHGKQSLENFHGQEPPWSILCGAQQVLHRISNSSIA